jgi:hypothetical protein
MMLALVLFALSSGPAGDADEGLWARLRRIESAFREGDALALRSSVSADGKVRVDLRGLTDGQASYGPGQLQVVFGHIFQETRTRDFTFGRDEVKVPSPGTAFAKGRWVRRSPSGGPEVVESVTFTLRVEAGAWRVVEIRSSR